MPALNQAQAISARWTPAQERRAPGAPIGRLNLDPLPVPEAEPLREGVSPERGWREPPDRFHRGEASNILARRWKQAEEEQREYVRGPDPRFAVLAIALRSTRA